MLQRCTDNARTFALLSLVLLMSPLHAQMPSPGKAVVADEQVTVSREDLRRELLTLSDQGRARALADTQGLQTVITRIFFRRQMALQAEQAGHTEDPLVQARLRRAREETLAEFLPREFLRTLEMPDFSDQARAYYDAHPDEFAREEKIYAAHILFKAPDDESKAKRREEAEAVLAKIRDGADFGDMAEEHSEDGSRYMKGDLGEFGRGQMVPEFDEAAFTLEAGETSGLVETRFGWHIIKVYNRQDATPIPYDDVSERIADKLAGEYRQEQLKQWLVDNGRASDSALDAPVLESLRSEFIERLDVPPADKSGQVRSQGRPPMAVSGGR